MASGVRHIVSENMKQTLMTLHEMASNAENCLLSLQTAFIYNTATPLKGCTIMADEIKEEERRLTKVIREIAKENSGAKPYVSIPGHLAVIGEKIGQLSEVIDQKIREEILFSDRAVTETIFLLQRLNEILWTTASLILARNTYLGMYVQESLTNLGKQADEYATLHEDRLIEGICLPKASSLYISMIDAMKSIIWHTKKIALNLGS